GVGIEWMTFIGPLQVVFVKPIGKKDGDQTSSFEFNIGQRF
ncbi:MAG: BamA/TamA family outer membrane protein, partial [Campylobacter sp.]